MSVSAPCPFSAISVVLLPCSQVSWHCPFRQIRLQMRGAMTTLKRSRVEERSVHHTSLWTLSQMTSRWEIREGILASFTALHRHPGTFNQKAFSSSSNAPTLLTEADFLTSHTVKREREKKARPPSCFLLKGKKKIIIITSLAYLSDPSVKPKCLASLGVSCYAGCCRFKSSPRSDFFSPFAFWGVGESAYVVFGRERREEREERRRRGEPTLSGETWLRARQAVQKQSWKWFPCWLFLLTPPPLLCCPRTDPTL